MTKKLWLGTLVMALAFGMTLIGCANEDRALNGNWFDGAAEYRFRNGNWEVWYEGNPEARGTYIARDGEITMTITHLHDEGTWLDRDGLRAFYAAETGMGEELEGWMAEMIDAMLDGMFEPQTGTYEISGDTLILTLEGEVTTLTRG